VRLEAEVRLLVLFCGASVYARLHQISTEEALCDGREQAIGAL
jgi:hypothetical protein